MKPQPSKTIRIFLFFVTICLLKVNGQGVHEPCYFDTQKKINATFAGWAEKKIRKAIESDGSFHQKHVFQSSNVKVIPVVVHVIHDGGVSNISDAQVQSQLDVLNEDFRKKSGTNGDGSGVDTEIEFCLAKKDPLGRCTNGIVRINSPLSNHQTHQRSQLSQLSYWDNTRYLNIYVVKNINNGSGTLGYASFPGGPANEDGIVVRHDYFGKIGTASFGLGRTTTHEAGHWLGLYHTFNNGCGTDTCMDGDYVCDTPPVALPNFNCPVSPNSCNNDYFADQVLNYMDYTDDNCKNMFSNGQNQRMQASLSSLRFDIWQTWNTDSTGCDSGFVNGPCNVIADFITLEPNICVGNSITFYDKSQNNPLSWQWYFPGGNPSSSSAQNPSVTYSVIGTYSVKLVSANANGADSLEQISYVNVTNPVIGLPLPFYESFETDSFPPQGITIDNPDNGITWERDTVAKAYHGNASAKINNLINTNYGQSDALLFPAFDFTSLGATPYLYFKWAYARSDPNYSDEMIVLVSKDCGVNWSQVFYRTGTALATGPTQTTPYVPDSATVWKNANISLAAYSTYSNVLIKIVNVTDGGNNLYIDYINLGQNSIGIEDAEAIENAVVLFPNPANDKITISIEDKFNPKEVLLYNNLGALVLSKKTTENFFSVDLAGLAGGLYAFFIRVGDEIICKKIVIE